MLAPGGDGARPQQAEMASCQAKPDSLNDDICDSG
jgi:hypothetical protein